MPALRSFNFFNNTGGLNLRHTDTQLVDTDAEEVENLHATSNGSWTTQDIGYTQINATALAFGSPSGNTVQGMISFTTEGGQTHWVVVAGGKFYTVSAGNGTAVERPLPIAWDTTAPVTFATFLGQLILFNGINVPMVWDGVSAIAPLAGWPAIIVGVTVGNPTFGAVYANRLAVAGDVNNPSTVYLSELENPENFTPSVGPSSPGAILVGPGDGEKITALHTLYLPLTNEEVLVVFKDRSTYVMTGSDADTFTLQKISGEFGAVGPRSVVQVGSELMFLSQEGITSLSTATADGNLTTRMLSRNIQPQINTLNRNALATSWTIHLRDRNEVWWAVPDGGSTQNQRILVMNYDNGLKWSRRSGVIAACGCVFQGQLFTGTYNGVLHRQCSGSSYNGAPISWTYRTPFYELGSPRQRKRIRDIELYLRQQSALSLTVKTAWDSRRSAASQETTTLTSTPDAESALFGLALFNADKYGLAGLSRVRLIPNGSGRSVQLELSGTAINQPIELQGWSITALTMQGFT
ncbi:MAG: hypothetical protein QE263_04225 [Vampirovibrionales bacterium]|nr:hypothetical protein [Vampirovibrionales bacterium]